MAAVHAGDITSAAAVALIKIKYREQDGIPLDTVMIDNCHRRSADEVRQFGYSFALQVFCDTVKHIFDNPVSVLHDACSDLEASAAEKHKFKSVAPGFNTAHTAEVHTV
jgi:hypothetical protein